MFQTIDGKECYVVEFDTMPQLPITGSNQREMLYAQALTRAIVDGVISMPGKYALNVVVHDDLSIDYNVYLINE